eukprot:COSAG01_NODE_36297_length_519_cov_2.485714_1_plen_111_part_10
MGVDPGFRHGCKLAVIAADGSLCTPHGTATIYPSRPAPEAARAAAAAEALALARRHGCRHFAVGNGQGHREVSVMSAVLLCGRRSQACWACLGGAGTLLLSQPFRSIGSQW